MRLNFIKLICLGITVFQASLLSGSLAVQAAEPLPIEPPATTSVGPVPSDQQWSPHPIGPQPTPSPQPTPHPQPIPPWRQGNNPLTHRDIEHLARGVGYEGESKITYYVHPRDPVSELGGEKHLFGNVYKVEGGPTETFNPGSVALAEHRGQMLQGNTADPVQVDFDKWQADRSMNRGILKRAAEVAEEYVDQRLNPPAPENAQPTPPPNPLPKTPQKTQPQEVTADPTPPPKPVPDIEEEKKRIAKEEARRKAVDDAIKKAEEERKKAEEEARKKAEEERQKAEEEARQKMEEANRDKTNKDVVGDNILYGGSEGVDNPEGKPEAGRDELYADEDSVKKLRGAEKKTAKLDKGKKKSVKGEKDGIDLAKGINVTDSFDKERAGKSKKESQEAQTGAGATLSERAGASKAQHERDKGNIDAQGQETDRAISETQKEHTTAQQTEQQERQTSIGTTIAKAVAGGVTSGVAIGLDNFFGGVGRGAGEQTSSDIGVVKKSKKDQGPSPSGSNTTAGTGTESQTPPSQGTGSGTKTQDQPGPEVKVKRIKNEEESI